MARWHTRWSVLPHAPIRRLEDNLWDVAATLPKIPIGRRMTLVRLADGRVVVHNAVPLEDAAMQAIEAWGKPSFLIVPSAYHRLDARVWKDRYPDSIVVAAPGARARASQALPVDAGPEAIPQGDDLRIEVLDGIHTGEMALMVGHADGRRSLVLNDVFFNVPHRGGLGGLVLRLMGSSGGPRVTRIMKRFGIRDRAATRAHLVRLAATPNLARIIMAHGEILEGPGVGATLRAAAERDLR